MKYFALFLITLLVYIGTSNAENAVQWTLNGSDGNPCLMAEMNIKANFSYTSNDSKVKNVLYEVPVNQTKVNTQRSSCEKNQSQLVVEWSSGNFFEIHFTNDNKSYELSSFKVSLNKTDVLIDSMDNKTVEITYIREINDNSFLTPSNFSFHCTKDQKLNNTNEQDASFIVLSKVQFEAFKSDKSKGFSLAKDCENNHFKPEIVPIAVGLSLIALIIIVLIAYIVGRRRQQARGYLNIM